MAQVEKIMRPAGTMKLRESRSAKFAGKRWHRGGVSRDVLRATRESLYAGVA